MGLGETKTKFILRSRRFGASLLAAYVALRVLGESSGLSMPDFSGVLGVVIDSFTSDDGILARGFQLATSLQALLLVFRGTDGAKLIVNPLKIGLGTLPFGGASAALLLALLIPLAAPASAAIAPYQPQLRIAWVAQVAGYRVHAYQGADVPVIEPWRPATGP